MPSFISKLSRGVRRRFEHSINNWRIKRINKEVQNHEPPPVKRPVVIFNASTRIQGLSLNAAYSLLSGWSLRLVGTPVVYFGCNSGMSQCVLGTNRENLRASPPCRKCVGQSKNLYSKESVSWFSYVKDDDLESMIRELKLDDLIAFEYQGIPLGELIIPSMRWVLRRHHLLDDEDSRSLFRQYILSAWNVARNFVVLIEVIDPLAVVVFNGMFFPEAVVRHLCMENGIRVITHEVGMMPCTGYFTTGQATAYPIDIPSSFTLNTKQNHKLDEYLGQRFHGNFSMAGIQFWPEMRGLDEGLTCKIATFPQMVSVFTNVVFDTSQGHANRIFPHMFSWLDLVLQVIKANKETLFVIRAHPDEYRSGKESRESVADWIKQNGVDHLPNVLFVNSSEYISSYELIQRSKFVMVYNSTIGLEATLMNSAVLCGGKARYTQLPTVFIPGSPEEYLLMAEEFLATSRIEIPNDFLRNARRFLYYQIFRTSLPFYDFIREEKSWLGYVSMKPFSWKELLPKNSQTLSVVVDGVVKNQPFLLSEEEE